MNCYNTVTTHYRLKLINVPFSFLLISVKEKVPRQHRLQKEIINNLTTHTSSHHLVIALIKYGTQNILISLYQCYIKSFFMINVYQLSF